MPENLFALLNPAFKFVKEFTLIVPDLQCFLKITFEEILVHFDYTSDLVQFILRS